MAEGWEKNLVHMSPEMRIMQGIGLEAIASQYSGKVKTKILIKA